MEPNDVQTLPKPPKRSRFKASLESDVPTDWNGMASMVGAVAGLLGFGGATLSMSRPDAAIANDDKIKAVATMATEANTKATDAKDIAQKAMQRTDTISEKLTETNKKIDTTIEKMDATNLKLERLIGAIQGMPK